MRHHTALVDERRQNGEPSTRRRAAGNWVRLCIPVEGGSVAGSGWRLGMNVMFYDPFIPDGGEQSVGFERRRPWKSCSGSDIVTVHTPLTDETRVRTNGQALSCMKKDVIPITTRGEVVDVDAVTEALKADCLAAAGLDVLPQELPDPKHPLFSALKNREEWIVGRVIDAARRWYSPDGARDCREKAARTVINYLTEGTILNGERAVSQAEMLHEGWGYGWHGNDRP